MKEDALLKLQTNSLELKLLMNKHDTILDEYIKSIESKNHNIAEEYYAQLSEINIEIEDKLKNMADSESKVVSTNRNDPIIYSSLGSTTSVANKLKTDNDNLSSLKRKLKQTEAANANASLERNSFRIKYLLICVLMIIVIILTIRAFVYESKTIDTLFIISALVLGAYHFFNKQV